jgi:hypothetical protein
MNAMPDTTYSSEGPECPYCGRQFTADEPFYYDEKQFTEAQCDECNRLFKVSVHIITSWECSAIEDATS